MRSFSGLFSAACSPSYHYKHYIIFFFQGIIFWRLQHALNLTKLSEFQRQCCFGVQRWASAAGKFCCRSLVFVTPVYNVMIAETLFYKRRGVNATYSQTSLTHHLQQHYFIVKLIPRLDALAAFLVYTLLATHITGRILKFMGSISSLKYSTI